MVAMIKAHSWNTDREILQGGSVRSQISGGWRNYLKQSHPWAPIDTTIQSDRRVEAFPGCLELPSDSQGWAEICIDGAFSMKRHIEEGNSDNSEPEFNMSLAVETQHNITGHISEANPAQMIYPGAWDSADLKLGLWQGRSVRVEKVVEIHTMPSGDSEFVEYSFLIRSSMAQVLAGADHNVSPWDESGHAELDNADAFVSLAGSQLRGTVLRTPVAWYYVNGEMIRVPVLVTFDVQSDGETVRATKHIPRTLIATALAAGSHLFTDATFNPDASPETTTVDGFTDAFNRNEPWADIITAPGGNSADSVGQQDLRVWAKNITDNWEYLSHLHFLFDTSSIGSGQSVDSASLTLSLYRSASDDLGLNWNVYSTNPASNTALVNGDHDSVGATAFSTAREIATEHWDWTAIAMTLDAAGRGAVDMEGVSKFGIAMQEDRENGTYGDPAWVASDRSAIKVRMAENGTNTPTLTVTHSEAASGGATIHSGCVGNAVSLSVGI